MSASDWLVPMDDIFTARLRCCTGCERGEGTALVDIATFGPLAVPYTLCERCLASDPKQRKLTAVLQQRYRQEPMQTGAGRCEDTAKN